MLSFVASVKPPSKSDKYVYASVPFYVPASTTGILYSTPGHTYKSAMDMGTEKPKFAQNLKCNTKPDSFKASLPHYSQPEHSKDLKSSEVSADTDPNRQIINLSCYENTTDIGKTLVCRRV